MILITNIEQAKEFLKGKALTFTFYTEHTFTFVNTEEDDYHVVATIDHSTNTIFGAYVENDMFFDEEKFSTLEIYYKEKLLYIWKNPEH